MEITTTTFLPVRLTALESKTVCDAIPYLQAQRLVADKAEAEHVQKIIDTLHEVSKRAF